MSEENEVQDDAAEEILTPEQQAIADIIDKLARPPIDVARVEDMVVVRDKDCVVEPVEARTLNNNVRIVFRPLDLNARFRYQLNKRSLVELEKKEMVAVLRDYVILPDMSGLTVKVLDQLDWDTVDDILVTLSHFSRFKQRQLAVEQKLVQVGKEAAPPEPAAAATE